jgi:hypothetical protein
MQALKYNGHKGSIRYNTKVYVLNWWNKKRLKRGLSVFYSYHNIYIKGSRIKRAKLQLESHYKDARNWSLNRK